PTRPRAAGSRGARSRWCLPTLPRRLPLAQERADPLARVLALEDGGEGLLLGGEALVEVAGAADRLDLLDRQRRLSRQLARPRQRRVEHLVVGDDLAREAELIGLLGEDGVAGEVHLERLAGPHQPRQPLRAAEARDDAQVDLRLA